MINHGCRLAVAGDPGVSDTDAALAWAGQCLADAALASVDLLVLPQHLLGATAQGAPLLSDAPPLRALAAAASRHRVAVACGYIEQCTGRLHDAVQIIDAQGLAIANYRAAHLEPDRLAAGLSPGQWLSQFRLGGAGVGVLAGADLLAPEQARALALAGAVILALPADIPAGRGDVAAALLQARAFENGCAIAFANRVAEPVSRILGPDGTTLAMAPQGLAIADVPIVRPAEAASRLAARRPLLYQKLASPHPPAGALRD